MERYVVKRALTQAHLQPLVPSAQQPQRHARLAPVPSASSSTVTSAGASFSSASGPLRRSLIPGFAPASTYSSTSRTSAGALSPSACHSLLLAQRPSSQRSPLGAQATVASGRSLTTSTHRSSKTHFKFLTSYAFAGKPRHSEEDHHHHQQQQHDDGGSSQSDGSPPPSPQEIGFPADSDVGRWRDALLKGGDAGEDALLCADMGTAGNKAIGVADGVGGWTESGVDPSLFSQALMFHASRKAEMSTADPDTAAIGDGAAPKAIMADAFDSVLKEPMVVAGSATACIITLDASSGIMRSANLGDSGFVVLRQGKGKQGLLYASPPQQLGFNTPLQLAKLPAEMRQQGSISNTPKDAATWECKLQHADLIILGTDGLYDNVDPRLEIPQFAKFIKERHHTKYAAQHPESPSSSKDSLAEDREFVEVLATNLVEYAKICQNSRTKQSPFEREAARYGIHYPGGKVDDVALVCCLVIEE